MRGAISSVPRGQWEAYALSMSPAKRMRRIILPQALALMLPPWGNLSSFSGHRACCADRRA
ncbi:MAG: hypothetical protein R3D56_03860 [Paracoccaceae bacterium]